MADLYDAWKTDNVNGERKKAGKKPLMTAKTIRAKNKAAARDKRLGELDKILSENAQSSF